MNKVKGIFIAVIAICAIYSFTISKHGNIVINNKSTGCTTCLVYKGVDDHHFNKTSEKEQYRFIYANCCDYAINMSWDGPNGNGERLSRTVEANADDFYITSTMGDMDGLSNLKWGAKK